MFNHVELNLPKLSRETIDGVRYYSVPDEDELIKLVSITSVTSHYNKEIFINWRKKVGDEEANRITKAATTRGTDFHTLTEHHLLNDEKLPKVPPISNFLFNVAKKKIGNINNIYALEGSLYSKQLGIAGTVDCVAEYEGELAIIDFKTSTKYKREEWIHDYFAQETAYAIMFQELTGLAPKKLVTIIACETGEPQIFEIYDKLYTRVYMRQKPKFIGSKATIPRFWG